MRGYLPIINIILVVLLVFVVGRGIYPAVRLGRVPETTLKRDEIAATAPKAPERQTEADYKIIDSRNIFYSKEISPQLPPISIPTALPTAPPTPLKLELQGTIVSSNKESGGFAAIKDRRTGKDDVYLVGDSIGDTGAVIVSIERNKVTLKRSGREEVLLAYKEEETGISSSLSSSLRKNTETKRDYGDIIKVLSPYKREVSKSGLHAAIGNIFQHLDTSRIEVRRNYLNKKERTNQRGYRVWNIPSGSIVAAMGVRDNDIIMRVNRKLIDNPKKALALFQEVQNAKTIKVEIERKKRRVILSYKIKP